MSIFIINTNTVTSKSKRAKFCTMNNSGFGPVKIIQEGVKRLNSDELKEMTIEQATRYYENGLAITVA